MPDPMWGRIFFIPAPWAQPPKPPMRICRVLRFPTTITRGATDLLPQARHAVALAERIDWATLARRRVINLNYPAGSLEQAKGIRVCPADQRGLEKRLSGAP